MKSHFRDLFILLKGLLMTADWMASAAQGHDDALDASRGVVGQVGPASVLDHLRARHERRRQKQPDLRPFTGYSEVQAACGKAEGHVLAIAPTGSGKTEAALLWALTQVEQGHARKILFLLPTMVTANSIHERLCEFFERRGHDVGLVHSTADLVKRVQDDGEEESDRADVRANDLSESHFFRPVTVGTVDQLLVPLFHAGRWALKTLAAADAAIVIDEVHAYEPHTAGLIILMIEQLRALGARFMVMSATMPENLRATVLGAMGETLGDDPRDVTVIQDQDLLDKARNEWKVCETPLSNWLVSRDAVGKAAASADFLDLWNRVNDRDEPLRILVVVNTVKRCQELARALKGYKPVCYHSKFIFRDRRKIEEHINTERPRLLIATQVVEVSLDIDYDLLLTECAPIDALVQRAGRVNRVRRETLGTVVVHPFEDGSEYVYDQPTGVLATSWELCRQNQGPLTERTLIRLVEQAYACRVLSETDAFQRIQEATRGIQARLSGVLDAPHPEEDEILKTRLGDYQISVIPVRFHARVLRLKPRERRRYELKMPTWYARIYKVRDHNSEDLPLCQMKYSSVYGGEFLTPMGLTETGNTIA